jgi:hypothetical protein
VGLTLSGSPAVRGALALHAHADVPNAVSGRIDVPFLEVVYLSFFLLVNLPGTASLSTVFVSQKINALVRPVLFLETNFTKAGCDPGWVGVTLGSEEERLGCIPSSQIVQIGLALGINGVDFYLGTAVANFQDFQKIATSKQRYPFSQSSSISVGDAPVMADLAHFLVVDDIRLSAAGFEALAPDRPRF